MKTLSLSISRISPLLATTFFLLTSLCFSQDTAYMELAHNNREKIDCPDLDYKTVFCKQAVSCRELWSKALLQECEARLKKYTAECKPHVCASNSLSKTEYEDLLEQSRLMRQKSYELWLKQHKIDLIQVDLEELAKGNRTR